VEGYQFTPPSGGGTDWDFSVQALDDGRSNGLDRIESYMSYSRIDTWADEHLHQQLIHDGWSRVTLGQWVFSATGSVDDEGDLSFPSVRALREQPYEDAGVDDVGQDDGAVHVRLVAPDGETLVDRTVAASHHVHDAGKVDGLVSVDVPFPLEAARFEATRDGATTTLNPVVRPIRDALERVPDRVLDGDPEEVRARFEADLDAVASLMADGDYATAAERVTELRTPLAGVVPASYEAALNQPTSEELLDLTGRMRERLDALAAYGGESSGGNCTPGHTAGDPPCKQVADDAEVLTTYDPSGSILPVSVRYPCGWDTDATEQFDDYAQVNASRSGFGGSVDVQVRAHYEPVAAGFLAAKTEDGDYDQVEYEYAGEPRTGLVSAASTASLGTLAYAVVPVQGERVLVELVSEMTPDTCDMETRPDWGLVKEMLRSLEPAAETTFEPATTGQAVVNEVDGFAVRYHAGEPRTDSYAVLASIENTGGQTTEITNYDVSVRLYDADGTAVHSAGIVVWNASGELAPGEQRQITVEDTLQDGVAPEDVARYELRLTCGGHADGVYCDS
jgi:archaellum component FlaG (FlaF/FlaG flagellin family)